MAVISPPQTLAAAAPFWLSLSMVPLAVLAAVQGGLWVLILPLYAWVGFSILDAITGLDERNADPTTPEDQLYWHRLITLIWFPVQALTVFGVLIYVTRSGHLGTWETIGLFFGIGTISGTIGINYAHELMHQKNRLERWLGDLLMTSVMYGHFRSEHLLVHHRYVCTPRDPVTARYNEGFWRFFPRVLSQCFLSALGAENALLARKKLSPWDRNNPFWRYGLLQAAFLIAAYLVAGWVGVALYLWQAFVAVWQLELVNYIEHYGLTRRHLGEGKYEHVQPRHSWNAAHQASNWLLINLQRHSDHHFKPDRRFPLLQTYGSEEAPQLPYGYPVMTALAVVPPVWRRVMNPRVRAWRKAFYPDITDWTAYKLGTLPLPR